ncbi:unnamed protein product [marine sediment metagenome]|uniref:Uncharacterized protein n=1 Tax=marine sediment metagenome TaxID=412755 RepID=X0YB08_9ZZZZ
MQLVTLTKTDLRKIECWARSYMQGVILHDGHIMQYWDKHSNDTLTYNKICQLLNIEGITIGDNKSSQR